MNPLQRRPDPARASLIAAALASGLAACSGGGGGDDGARFAGATRSTTIALTAREDRLVVVNREVDTVTILRADADPAAPAAFLAEVEVGDEPRYVAVSPDDRRAFVSNAIDGTVSVVRLVGPQPYTEEHVIDVGDEPRGIAITPNGSRVYVANHTAGTVSVIDGRTLAVVGEVDVGGNPTAIAITNDGDGDDADETVLVTRFYAELVAGGPGEAFDTGKEGWVEAFSVGTGAVVGVPLAPVADAGFTADRRPFCVAFNANAANATFCPDPTETDPTADVVDSDPQGAYPNQLQSILVRDGTAWVPSIAASPAPPVRFNVNVQALVHAIDVGALTSPADRTVNLNAQIKLEAQPPIAEGSLARLFANDVVALDADAAGECYLFVSRGGNCVIRAEVDANGRISIGAPDVVRFQTGNLPSGVAITADGARAYVNNEGSLSVTVIDLAGNVVLERDVPSSTPPALGSAWHEALVGKIAFHTALGLPDSGVLATPLRDIVPLDHRNKASDNGWSSCASCHPDGLADGATWIFGTGPRQTVPLDAFFSKVDPADQRISNWSGVMGSITDFNNNARGVQGGTGFAGNPPPATIFQHGITVGGSDSLDAMTAWCRTIRAPVLPDTDDPTAFVVGSVVFEQNCAACHAGDKWSKSTVVYDNDPTFTSDPNAGGVVVDPGVTNAGPQIVSFTFAGETLRFLDGVGTHVAGSALEVRGQPPTAGNASLGALGFNAPSLLGTAYHAPYLHDGSARTLADVFPRHALGAGTIQSQLTPEQREALLEFLASIDGETATFPSATDAFLTAVGR